MSDNSAAGTPSSSTVPSPRQNHGILAQALMSTGPGTSTTLLPQDDSTTTTLSSERHQDPLAMGHRNQHQPTHSSIEIHVPSDAIYVRGVGRMAEPTLLAGTVVLSLSEPMSIKEITLQMTGKARLPAVGGDGYGQIRPSAHSSVVVYSHDWTFLAGEKRAHTLKEGRHIFPFETVIDASVPSSLSTNDPNLGISYKLKATAVRTSFASNFHTQRTVHLHRSLALDALEYQQSLEIENTWPGKIMYLLSLPHKAWAAGDTVCTLVKFSPLTKGVHIKSICTTVNEHSKVHHRFGVVENKRIITSVKHHFLDGQPVVIDERVTKPSTERHNSKSEASGSLLNLKPFSALQISSSSSGASTPAEEFALSRATSRADCMPEIFLPSASTSTSTPTSSSASSSRGSPFSSHPTTADNSPETSNLEIGEQDLVALIPITVPSSATPSHSAEPIEISYRIRWLVSVVNPDGHTSELRCSLPIMILNHCLLTESRLATNETRRLCFGLAPSSSSTEDLELPSYSNHVLDRVANSHFPPDAFRVNNVWPRHGMNSQLFNDAPHPISGPQSLTSSTISTPDSEPSNNPLEWCNNELMYSLGDNWRNNMLIRNRHRRSQGESDRSSRMSSRASSRASSPERSTTYTHQSSNSSIGRNSHNSSNRTPTVRHNLFSLRPFTSFSSSRSSSNRNNNTRQQSGNGNNIGTRNGNETQLAEPVHPVPLTTGPPDDRETFVMSAFNEVPDYSVASRGFLGGGIPPLDLVRNLPSYQEVPSGRRA